MSFDIDNPAARKSRMASDQNAAFDKWMNEPLVRMSISTIPAGEHKDALQMLLRSAFDAGHSSGQGVMAGEFLQAILMGERKRTDRP